MQVTIDTATFFRVVEAFMLCRCGITMILIEWAGLREAYEKCKPPTSFGRYITPWRPHTILD